MSGIKIDPVSGNFVRENRQFARVSGAEEARQILDGELLLWRGEILLAPSQGTPWTMLSRKGMSEEAILLYLTERLKNAPTTVINIKMRFVSNNRQTRSAVIAWEGTYAPETGPQTPLASSVEVPL